MMQPEKRVLALAGLVQAIHLVSSAAKTGLVSQDSLEKTLKPIFVQNPSSISEVYSGTTDISLGLNLLADMLYRFDVDNHGDIVRHGLSVIGLERALANKPETLTELGAGISRIDRQRMLAEESGAIDADTIAALANLYESTISHIEPRIRISGNKNHLQNVANIQRIRALLLSAIRSAVLWHQVGGRRWQLLLGRGSMKRSIQNLI